MNKETNYLILFEFALFFLFLTLKLTNYIDWSWWWVTSPLWGSFILGVVLIILGMILLWISNLFRKE